MHKIYKFISYTILLTLLFSLQSISAENLLSKNISKYIYELKKFKCNFIQSSPDGTVSEGSMIYSENKIRVNYIKPYVVTFVAKKNKAMYFNEDLMELHYFNPDKTAFHIFKSFFELHNMPKDTYEIIENNNVINVELIKILVDDISNFSIIFQNSPIELKKIKWTGDDGNYTFSIYNLNSEVVINKETFSMVNPILNN